mgnify:CR=1 FL=1
MRPRRRLIAALTQSRNLLLRAERRVEEERAEIFGQGISDFLILIRAFSYAQRHDFRIDALRPLAIHAEAARQVRNSSSNFLRSPATKASIRTPVPRGTRPSPDVCWPGSPTRWLAGAAGGTLVCDIVHGRRGTACARQRRARQPTHRRGRDQ